MATNHRFEPDMTQRRRNVNIELTCCLIIAVITFFDIYFGLGLIDTALFFTAVMVYILYINPKFMNRKLTK